MLPLVKTGVWRCIVFDLDGTVANTIPLIIASYDHALTTVVGIPADPELMRSWIGQTLWDTFAEHYPDHVEALVESYVDFNLSQLERQIQRFDGMADLLTELSVAGARVGVATSKRRRSAELTLAAVGLETRVPLVVAMEDTATHKPQPEPLLLAVERMGARPEAAVYIGDAVVDIQAAKAAGMASIAVTWGAGERAALQAAEPTVLVDTLAELRAALLG